MAWPTMRWPALRRTIKLDRRKLLRAGMTAAILAGVVGAAYGAGYRSSGAVLGNGSIFVQKGRTVTVVNWESGQPEAKAAHDLATKQQRLEVVNVAPGFAYVVNNETKAVWRLRGDTMQPERVDGITEGVSPGEAAGAGGTSTPGPAATSTRPPEPGASSSPGNGPSEGPQTAGSVSLATGGGVTYALDTARGVLSLLPGRDQVGHASAEHVALSARIDEVVVDATGTAWALSRSAGRLYEVVGTSVRGDSSVSNPGERAELTLAHNRPVILSPERGDAGHARILDDGVAHPEIAVTRHPPGSLRVAQPGADDPVLVTVVQPSGTVVVVDFRTGVENSFELQGRTGTSSYGRPAVAHDRIYVPDYTRNEVVILELSPLRQVGAVGVPGGGIFELTPYDGQVFVHHGYHRRLLAFEGDKRRDSDKGPGDGLVEENRPTTGPSPTISPSVPPTPSPSASQPPRPRTVQVPPVVGMDSGAGCAAITATQMKCVKVSRAQPGCETGKIIAQVPDPGSRVLPRSSVVTITVCGPTLVPSVVGLQATDACRAIEQADLVCAQAIGGVPQTPAERGKVIKQDPLASTEVPRQTVVTVTHLDWQNVIVPNVTRMDPFTACVTLALLEFTCAQNPEAIHWETNVVHIQNPVAGAVAPHRASVQIDFQMDLPAVLHRFKLQGEEVRCLTIASGCPGVAQPDIGSAYPVGAVVGSPNRLQTVYQFRCSPCVGGRSTGFFYTTHRDDDWYMTRYSSRWSLEAAVFSCFDPAAGVGRPLVAMFKDSEDSWAFAVRFSGEYQTHQSAGYKEAFVICHIW
jgi:PASTA domain